MEPAPVSNGIDRKDPLKSFLNGTRNPIQSNTSTITSNKATTGSLNTLLTNKTLKSSITTTGGQFPIPGRSATATTNPAALQIRQSFEALIKANPIPLPTTTNTTGNAINKHTITSHHPSPLISTSLIATEKNQSNNKTAPRKEQRLHQAAPAPVYEKVSRFGHTRVKPVLPTIVPRNKDVTMVEEDKAELEEEEVDIEVAKQQDRIDKIDLGANMLDGGTEVEDSEATQTQKEEDEEKQQQQQKVEQKPKSNTKEMKMFQRRSSSIRPISIDTIDKSNLQKKNYATTIGVGGSVTLAAAAAAAGAAAAAAAQEASSEEKQPKKRVVEEREKATAVPVDGTTKKTCSVTKAATPKTVSKPSSSGEKKKLIAEQPPKEEQQPAPTNAPALASDTVVINDNKVYGCSKCRFNARGCARCRTDGTKPPPRGKKYKLLLAQQAAAGVGGDVASAVPAAAAKEKKDKGPAKPSRRRVVPEIVSQPPQQQEQKAVQVEEKKEKEVAVVEKEEEAPKVKKPRRQSITPKTAGEDNTKAKNIPSPVVAPPVVVDDEQQSAAAPQQQQQQQQSISPPPPMASSPSFPKVEGVPEQVLKEMIKGKWRKNGKCGLCVNCLKPTAKRGCMAQRALRDVGLLAHTAKSLAGASKRRSGDHDHYGGNGGGSIPSSKKENGGKKRRKVDGGGNEVVDKDGWTVTQVEALQRAWVEISPTVPNFWALVAKRVRGKSASECFAKHFSRHPTPRHKKVPAAATKKLLDAAKQSYQKGGDGNGGGDVPAYSGLTGGVSKLAMQNAARTHARQLRMQQQAEEEAAGGGGGSSKNELVEVLEEQRQKHRYIDHILQKRRGKALGAVAPHVVARVAPAAAAMARRIQAADAGGEVREALAAMQEAEEKAEEVLSQEDADYYWSDAE